MAFCYPFHNQFQGRRFLKANRGTHGAKFIATGATIFNHKLIQIEYLLSFCAISRSASCQLTVKLMLQIVLQSQNIRFNFLMQQVVTLSFHHKGHNNLGDNRRSHGILHGLQPVAGNPEIIPQINICQERFRV